MRLYLVVSEINKNLFDNGAISASLIFKSSTEASLSQAEIIDITF